MEDARATCQRHLEDKRELKAALSEAQKKLTEALADIQDRDRCSQEQQQEFQKQVGV